MIYIRETPEMRKERLAIAAVNNLKQTRLTDSIEQDRIARKQCK